MPALTPTQAQCLKAMVEHRGVLMAADAHRAILLPRGETYLRTVSAGNVRALMERGFAQPSDRSAHHSIIEPTEAGRAEARRLEEEKTT